MHVNRRDGSLRVRRFPTEAPTSPPQRLRDALFGNVIAEDPARSSAQPGYRRWSGAARHGRRSAHMAYSQQARKSRDRRELLADSPLSRGHRSRPILEQRWPTHWLPSLALAS